MLSTVDVIAGIAWDPTIRGLLTVVVGVAVLMGSVYLLVGTNTGTRLGFLISAAGFFGWMVLMGLIWWIYGIGMQGAAPSWEVIEVNSGDLSAAQLEDARELETGDLPPAEELNDIETTEEEFAQVAEAASEDLGDWHLLPLSNKQVGEAQAAVDEFLPESDLGTAAGIESPSDYVTLYAFDAGGKERLGDDPNRWDRIVNWVEQTIQITHPPHYALVQVQPVVDAEAAPGEPPPSPEADEDSPVISVIMERDIGDRRFPAAMITISSGLIFGLLCYLLHVRDRRLDEHLAVAAAST